MEPNQVIIVLLRRPGRTNDERSDPFWEFGSFGLTHCHKKNLLHFKRAKLREGKRLAFAQGGKEGFKLVYLSPPIKIQKHRNVCEATWEPKGMPFRYETAPLLINNFGETEFAQIKKEIKDANRFTWSGKFSSKFRTRCTPLSPEISKEILKVFMERRNDGDRTLFARKYFEALPYKPNPICEDREALYLKLLAKAEGKNSLKFQKC